MTTVTTQTLNYPHEFRPVPQFLLDVPAGWNVFEYPNALFAVSSVDADQPWMNIIVTHERIVAGTRDQRLAERYTELLATYDGIVIEPEKGFTFDDNVDFIGRDTTYTDADTGESISLVEITTTAPNRVGLLVEDMFTMRFITPAKANALYGDVVLDTIMSFRFA